MKNVSTDYLLVIDTNSYAGNFERTLFNFLQRNGGLYDVYDSCNIAEVDEGENDVDVEEYFEANTSKYLFDEEYGDAPVGIVESPKYVREKSGETKHQDDVGLDDVIEKKLPIYNSVAIAIQKIPEPEILDKIKKECYRFAETYGKRFSESFKIEEFRIQKITTTVEVETVYI